MFFVLLGSGSVTDPNNPEVKVVAGYETREQAQQLADDAVSLRKNNNIDACEWVAIDGGYDVVSDRVFFYKF